MMRIEADAAREIPGPDERRRTRQKAVKPFKANLAHANAASKRCRHLQDHRPHALESRLAPKKTIHSAIKSIQIITSRRSQISEGSAVLTSSVAAKSCDTYDDPEPHRDAGPKMSAAFLRCRVTLPLLLH
ncbi:hypothetical protein [Xanthobacter autotrophicus]|uniref:hypothetical protein n=1 Tax=Xanthobacter autotrophicus TaxID=280 RepID=UPI00372A6A1F